MAYLKRGRYGKRKRILSVAHRPVDLGRGVSHSVRMALGAQTSQEALHMRNRRLLRVVPFANVWLLRGVRWGILDGSTTSAIMLAWVFSALPCVFLLSDSELEGVVGFGLFCDDLCGGKTADLVVGCSGAQGAQEALHM